MPPAPSPPAPPPPPSPARLRLHRLFEVGALFKGIEGVLELVAAAWLAVDPQALHNVLFRLTAKEILHDPEDRIAQLVRHAADALTLGSHGFAVAYLAGHGAIKVLLAESLLRERPWAFPFAIAVLLLFAVYQVYRFTHTHAPVLPLLSAIDVAIAWLVWREGNARRAAAA